MPTSAAGARAFDRRVWLLTVGTFAIGTDAFVVSGILPAIAADLRVGLDAAGQVATAYALTYALGALLLAALTVKLPREQTVTAALGLFALSNALCALAPLYVFLIAAHVLTCTLLLTALAAFGASMRQSPSEAAAS